MLCSSVLICSGCVVVRGTEQILYHQKKNKNLTWTEFSPSQIWSGLKIPSFLDRPRLVLSCSEIFMKIIVDFHIFLVLPFVVLWSL